MGRAGMAGRDIWVFGYGSLIWDPGFPWLERAPALLRGYHRAMCVYSHVWRGTPEKPGLVLGLDRGGSCRGLAFRVAGAAAARAVEYLEGRERVTEVYLGRELPVTVMGARGPRRLRALAYVADRAHPQYAGKLPLQAAARLIRQGRGRGGANLNYLATTVARLEALGIPDRPLGRLLDAVNGGAAGNGAA